ncbi:DMT family transporter [Aestuariispira insulae]|uniref:Drug/metabolite transporter (DMT)-like permease n=1 Tax=Aestuariispira insulae TaxID=1461337 RepID=A0A3D9HE59_9PROT|nr:DMT family transporter [Aestuariispira insulae]RED47750.1 drug/metabolite transporter (DMT)-like permease [Aestuariispira insulae]
MKAVSFLPPVVRTGTTPMILFTGTIISASFILAKLAVESGIPSFAVYFWQLLTACLILLVLTVVRGEKLPVSRRHLTYYLLNGLMGSCLPQLIAYAALGHIPAGLFTVLITLSPLFTYLVSSLADRRFLPWPRLAGILTGLIGISLATFGGFAVSGVNGSWVLIAALSPMFLAVNNVYRAKAYPQGTSPLALALGSMLFQILLLWPVLIWTGHDYQPFSLTGLLDWAVLLIGLITAVSFILTFELQKRTDGLGFSQVGYVVTLAGILLGAWIFNEPLSPVLLISLILLFIGLGMTNGHLHLPIGKKD